MLKFLQKIIFPRNVNENAAPAERIQAFYAASGVTVTADTALKLAAVWRAVDLISSQVGKMPCNLFENIDGNIAKLKDDVRFRLLWREPSEGMTAFYFFKTLISHVVYRGNAYAYVKRDENFQVSELWIIPPEYCTPQRKDGEISYLIKLKDKIYQVPYYDILHFKGLGYDGLIGYSVIEYFATDGGLAQSMRDFTSEFFANGSIPSVIVSPSTPLAPDQFAELKKSWSTGFTGTGNRHKSAVSPAPLNINTINFTARDAQLIEARQFSVRDIANWFGVPPHKLGDNSRTAYNSIEAENLAFLTDTLDPWLVSFEQELWIKLLTEEEKRAAQKYFEFNRDSLLRTDTKTRYEMLVKATGAPVLTVNEARKILNFNSIDGGDELLRPLNMGNDNQGGSNEQSA